MKIGKIVNELFSFFTKLKKMEKKSERKKKRRTLLASLLDPYNSVFKDKDRLRLAIENIKRYGPIVEITDYFLRYKTGVTQLFSGPSHDEYYGCR